MSHALITGGAGFIGSHLADDLVRDGWQVTVIDNFDLFYEPELKKANIKSCLASPNYRLFRVDIRDYQSLTTQLTDRYDVIVHLAAKAGVRPSILDPITYQEVNIRGTQNLLEFAKERGVNQFVFASSSSVYGVNPSVPWSEDERGLMPISPYAATKVAGELLGHVYSHLYPMRFIALRFFTVYGPRQRPDLAIHKFARLMMRGESIPVYGDGSTSRDYTYIDDIIKGIRGAIEYNRTKYEVINLGNSQTITLNEMLTSLEASLGKRANIEHLPEQIGDVPRTFANIDKAKKLLGYRPLIDFNNGIKMFISWFINKVVQS